MVTATALVVFEKGAPFKVTEVELAGLQPHEVLVDLVATGICRTDIACQNGKHPVDFPIVLGHEGSGVVREVGSAVQGIVKGDHVVLSYNYCGQCRSCEAQQTYQCDTSAEQNFGAKRPDGTQTITSDEGGINTCFFGQSSFCNPAVVQEASCVKVDKKLPLDVICALGCGFQTGAGAFYNIVQPSLKNIRYLAVYGVGGVGCAAIMAARQTAVSRASGSFSIIAIDINDERLSFAKELGATHVVNSTGSKSSRELIMEITNGNGLDAAIDCSGAMPVIEEMISLLGPGGIAVTIGAPVRGSKVQVDVFDMLIRCKTYRGCHQGNAYSKDFIPWLAELYVAGHFPLEKMQKKYSPSDINVACEDMMSGKVVKPILHWRS